MNILPAATANMIQLGPTQVGLFPTISDTFDANFVDLLNKLSAAPVVPPSVEPDPILPLTGKALPDGNDTPSPCAPADEAKADAAEPAVPAPEAASAPMPLPASAWLPDAPVLPPPHLREPDSRRPEPTRIEREPAAAGPPRQAVPPLPPAAAAIASQPEQQSLAGSSSGQSGRDERPTVLARTVPDATQPTGAAPATTLPSDPPHPLTAAAPGHHASAPERGTDFAAVVDRIVAAREAAGDAAVTVAVRNQDFGPIALRFEPTDRGFSVTATSPDPDFVRAVSAAAPSEQGSWQADSNTGTARHDAADHRQHRSPSASARPHAQSEGVAARPGDEFPAAPPPAAGVSGLYA